MTVEDIRTPLTVRRECEQIFRKAGVEFTPLTHQPVLDYQAAADVRRAFLLTGVETKSLFIKTKKGLYVMFVTTETARVDWKKLRDVVGDRVMQASPEDLTRETGCRPGCAVPLGLPSSIHLVITQDLLAVPRIIFSPGPPEETLEVSSAEWNILLAQVANPVTWYK